MEGKRLLALALLFCFFVFGQSAGICGDSSKKGKGLDLNNLNTGVKPSEDFFEYGVGGWVKNHPIPDDQTRWGAFNFLVEENSKAVRKILDNVSAVKNAPKGSPEQKIGDFFNTAMDSARIENDGIKPLEPFIKKCDELHSKEDLTRFLVEEHLAGSGAFFNFFSDVDAKNSNTMAAYFYQSGLGLPDVEYYTDQDDRSKEIREKYVKHMANMFALLGIKETEASDAAARIMNIEMMLAKESFTLLENRDPQKTYNKVTFDELKKMSPGFDWDLYFKELGINMPEYFIVSQPKFMTAVGNVYSSTTLEDLKLYMKWNMIRNSASQLNTAFVSESFDFNSKFLAGAKAVKPRWRRVLNLLNATMGELLGQIYVKEYFPASSKERAEKIVRSLLVSMGERINGVSWMSDETKKAASVKLKKFGVKIGYPDKWKDYSALQISNDSYYMNVRRASVWASNENLKKIGKDVDRTEWEMSPQTVNAYYSPTRNEIVFPAAILQPPFFNAEADDAVNYGAMGAVIGHEISHGFDDQGRQFDADGNINDWWTEEDGKKFEERANLLVEQFNGIAVIDTFHVNGALTLGENIGDLGGLTVSMNAFKKTDQYKNNEVIDGFTPAQRFYLSWAQVWAESQRPQALKLQLKTDVHSPGKARVLGPLRNLNDFFEAFSVKEGDFMRLPEDKIARIW